MNEMLFNFFVVLSIAQVTRKLRNCSESAGNEDVRQTAEAITVKRHLEASLHVRPASHQATFTAANINKNDTPLRRIGPVSGNTPREERNCPIIFFFSPLVPVPDINQVPTAKVKLLT